MKITLVIRFFVFSFVFAIQAQAAATKVVSCPLDSMGQIAETPKNPREIWLAFARATTANSDFKYLSDLILRPYSEAIRWELVRTAKTYRRTIFDRLVASGQAPAAAAKLSQTAYARRLVESLFEAKTQLRNVDSRLLGKRKVLVDSERSYPEAPFTELGPMFGDLEATWPTLIKRTVSLEGGSLLPAPYPILIAGGRFRESYYWDSFFGSFGLFLTGRGNIALFQFKNFVNGIQRDGFIRNGGRDYYTRSQPPVASLLARKIYQESRESPLAQRQATEEYLLGEGLEALEKDYNGFWMTHRLDENTGLNFYGDRLNTRRPEEHSNDRKKQLARTLLDERAEAESGQDFSNLWQGEANRTIPVQLNAFLYAYERDLSWLYSLKARDSKVESETAAFLALSRDYKNKSALRKMRMDTFMRTPEGLYGFVNRNDLSLRPGLSGEVFSLLFVNALTPNQADQFIPAALQALEMDGGIAASSLFDSPKQWDGANGWAPFQIMAIQGLLNYGRVEEAERLARKWLKTGLNIYQKTGQFYERSDVSTMGLPQRDSTKYPNQVGFLWQNSSLIFALSVLGFNFVADESL